MKNDSNIITTPDPIYGIGQTVKYEGSVLRVRDVVWSSLDETWVYSLESFLKNSEGLLQAWDVAEEDLSK